MKGILDRFEDNDKAVILIEELNEEWIVPIDSLPIGSTKNTYFQIENNEGNYEIIAIDPQATEEETQRSSALLAKLRERGRGSKFRKK